MASIDTNVLVRYLTQDDEQQTQIAHQFVHTHQQLYVPITVILELEWVLRSRYKYEKAKIIETYASLLSVDGLNIADEEAIETCLMLYNGSNADFADCLHTALTQNA